MSRDVQICMLPIHLFILIATHSGYGTSAEHVLSLGTFFSLPGNQSYTVSAPHGGFDANTETIAREVGLAISWNVVTATGFRTWEHPFNVNRPTQGINVSPEEENATPAAIYLFEEFKARIEALGPPQLYVEIHGNNRKKSENLIEIATAGVSLKTARIMKTLLQTKLIECGLGSVVVLIDGVDSIYFQAKATKDWGTLKTFQPALHIELNYKMRHDWKKKTVSALAKALPMIASYTHTHWRVIPTAKNGSRQLAP